MRLSWTFAEISFPFIAKYVIFKVIVNRETKDIFIKVYMFKTWAFGFRKGGERHECYFRNIRKQLLQPDC